MKTLINTLTPRLSTFVYGLNIARNDGTIKNAIFNNFMSRVDLSSCNSKLYHDYKIFVTDCCVLAVKSGKRVFEVVNDVAIKF